MFILYVYRGKFVAEITSVSVRCEKFRWLPANNFDRFSPIGGENEKRSNSDLLISPLVARYHE